AGGAGEARRGGRGAGGRRRNAPGGLGGPQGPPSSKSERGIHSRASEARGRGRSGRSAVRRDQRRSAARRGSRVLPQGRQPEVPGPLSPRRRAAPRAWAHARGIEPRGDGSVVAGSKGARAERTLSERATTMWVRTQEQLAHLAESLSGASALALDTESDSLHHHVEKVCLVQLATDRGDACLVDPLVLRDLSPLAPIMADRGIAKILHGADYDVTTLKRDFGFRFAGLFDTMTAARFLGRPQIGLQALAQAELGVALSKESQRDDWSRRPLSPTQEQYALADVAHLLVLQARLAGELRQLGRLAWVEEESDAVAALEPARHGRDAEAYQKVKGMR